MKPRIRKLFNFVMPLVVLTHLEIDLWSLSMLLSTREHAWQVVLNTFMFH